VRAGGREGGLLRRGVLLRAGCPAAFAGAKMAGAFALEEPSIDPRSVIFAFGVGSGTLLGFVLGCFATWGWLRRMGLMRSREEWRRARRGGAAD
jgi:hypothetical protein